MANKKFSEFTVKTDNADVDFLVGYEGSDNVRISPENAMGYESGSHTTTWNVSWGGESERRMNYVKVGKMCTVEIYLSEEDSQSQSSLPLRFTLPFNAAQDTVIGPIVFGVNDDSYLPTETRSIGSQFLATEAGSNEVRLLSVNSQASKQFARMSQYDGGLLSVEGTITYITQ